MFNNKIKERSNKYYFNNMHKIRQIWHPEVYHGESMTSTFFEGWYFKLVDKSRLNSIVIIPAVYLDPSAIDSHAFIQILDNKSYVTIYQRFSLDEFSSDQKKFGINLGKNRFTLEELYLDMQSTQFKIQGSLTFHHLKPWPVKLFSPGAMGWYGLIPFMQCYHDVLSFNHEINGWVNMNGDTINFDLGSGYIEKDWGVRFPSSYIWLQCNHFNQENISLMVSIANIPWIRGSFRGFLIGMYFQNKLYRFTNYTHARIEFIKNSEQDIHIVVTDRKSRMEICATKTAGGVLYGPTDNGFGLNTQETLDSTVSIKFVTLKNRRTIFEGIGRPAALEINGKLNEILS